MTTTEFILDMITHCAAASAQSQSLNLILHMPSFVLVVVMSAFQLNMSLVKRRETVFKVPVKVIYIVITGYQFTNVIVATPAVQI